MSKRESSVSSNVVHFHIVTLFPGAFNSYLAQSIIGRSIKDKKITVSFYDPRDFTTDRHRRIDRRPYGGGPGMVVEALPVARAVEKAVGKKRRVKIIFFSTAGRNFSGSYAKKVASDFKHVVLIAGHYEGIDIRIKKMVRADEVSVGPYILTGGELPALIILDAVARYVPAVLGNKQSLEEDRFASPSVYTRPEVILYKGRRYCVPKVLLSGHHRNIEKWKKKKQGS